MAWLQRCKSLSLGPAAHPLMRIEMALTFSELFMWPHLTTRGTAKTATEAEKCLIGTTSDAWPDPGLDHVTTRPCLSQKREQMDIGIVARLG